VCDGLPPSCSREVWRSARKIHRCCACAERIEVGHRYHYLSGVWDGEPRSYKHCARCWEIYLTVSDEVPDAELQLDCGESWDSLFGEPPPSELAELAFMTPAEAQRKVRRRIFS
jgi:hypothetical protein